MNKTMKFLTKALPVFLGVRPFLDMYLHRGSLSIFLNSLVFILGTTACYFVAKGMKQAEKEQMEK